MEENKVLEKARREAKEREERRWKITCATSIIALIASLVSVLLPAFLK